MSVSSLLKVLFIACVLANSGCSSLFGEQGVFRGKSRDYLRTDTLETITLPEGMSSRSLDELYQIPEVDPRDEFGDPVNLGQYEIPRPQARNMEEGGERVKLQRIGDKKWIYISASTSQVWPRTQNFLAENGLAVAVSNPAKGIIETADVIFADDDSKKSRFRILIEKGIHPETTEIHVVQVEFPVTEASPQTILWPETSMNTARDEALLLDLASALAGSVSNTSASLLGQNVGGAVKVEFLQNQTEPTLRLNLFRRRALASIDHALEKEGLVRWERDDNKGLFYFAYDLNKTKNRNIFTRWFRKTLPKKAPHSIAELLAHLAPEDAVKNTFATIDGAEFGEPLPNAIGYLLVLNSGPENTIDITVRDAQGRKPDDEKAKFLLRLIRKNLI